MYIKGDKTYSEAGHYLICNQVIGYSIETQDGIKEVKLNEDEFCLKGNTLIMGNGIIHIVNRYEKGDLKASFVKKRYSNDDQIAIMLNGNEDDMNRMQSWREWSGRMADIILELNIER